MVVARELEQEEEKGEEEEQEVAVGLVEERRGAQREGLLDEVYPVPHCMVVQAAVLMCRSYPGASSGRLPKARERCLELCLWWELGWRIALARPRGQLLVLEPALVSPLIGDFASL